MGFLSKFAEAGHLAAGTVQHLFALASAGESIPEIVATEALEIIRDTHNRIKAHHDEHVQTNTTQA